MDLYKAIRELKEERARIDRIISSLEAIIRAGGSTRAAQNLAKTVPVGRRGRKSMGREERLQVSERMSRYWAARRAAKAAEREPEVPTTSAPASQ